MIITVGEATPRWKKLAATFGSAIFFGLAPGTVAGLVPLLEKEPIDVQEVGAGLGPGHALDPVD